MILKLEKNLEYELIRDYISGDSARNYFIKLAFESKRDVYEDIYYEIDDKNRIKAVLFKRKSGNLQFYSCSEFDFVEFSKLIRAIKFDALIGPKSYCDKLNVSGTFSSVKEGAFISELKDSINISTDSDLENIEIMKIEDVDEIIDIYKAVFTSFSSKDVIIEKLKNGRGRGIILKNNGKIVSVAQSEFEESNSAVIVGVATRKGYEGMGFATRCLNLICKELISEGKILFLQYDNLKAGSIYRKMGFEIIDQIKFYNKN